MYHTDKGQQQVSTVKETMHQAMAENKTWPGALAPIAAAHDRFDSKLVGKTEDMDKEGSAAWLVGMRKIAGVSGRVLGQSLECLARTKLSFATNT